MGRPVQTLESLFKRTHPKGEHMLFIGALDKDGYGIASVGGVKMLAHRAAWLLVGNAVPDGQYVLHRCHNRRCINPDHLYAGTQKQNVQDQFDAGTFVYGENSGSSILTDELVREIRASSESTTHLASKLNVSYHTVWDVRKLRSWKHVK
jgi:hypothetical protein